MNVNKALWEKGDFTRIAESMRASGAALIETLAVGEGLRVLDVGCGDGTTALPAAERGADVLGIDIAANLVAAGNRRAATAGLANLRFQEGDASDLRDVPDDGFDLVLSMFGAMFAPRPLDVAKELVRVTRPGGRIVMGNWIPGDPTLVAQVLKTSAAYTPPPPEGFVSPMLWGDEAEVTKRFVAAGVDERAIAFQRDTFYFRTADTPGALLDTFLHFYGPTMTALEAAEKAGNADALTTDLRALFDARNESPVEGETVIPATFLRVTVSV